jgi:hypothetical protein
MIRRRPPANLWCTRRSDRCDEFRFTGVVFRQSNSDNVNPQGINKHAVLNLEKRIGKHMLFILLYINIPLFITDFYNILFSVLT